MHHTSYPWPSTTKTQVVLNMVNSRCEGELILRTREPNCRGPPRLSSIRSDLQAGRQGTQGPQGTSKIDTTMRALLALALAGILWAFFCLGAAEAQRPAGGLFDSIRSTFFNRRPPRGPPPQFPPPQQFQQFPPQQFQQQQQFQPQFQPQQQQQFQQFQQQPQQQFQQFQQQPQQQGFQQPQQQVSCGRAFLGCPGSCGNHEFEGRRYILTYRVDDSKCSTFTGEEADEYCRQQGGRAASLDTPSKAQHFIQQSITDARRFWWTGGRVNHARQVVEWPSGQQEGYVRGQGNWSTTGGKKPVPEAQPDNRDGNEVCLAVLNNFYNDGVKYHDVACHHKKPTICEL